METKGWRAWVDAMPPRPPRIHVTGEVYAANPGVGAELSPLEPQAGRPEVLSLELRLTQQPGIWPQVMTWVRAAYQRQLSSGEPGYTKAKIFHDQEALAEVDVSQVF